MIFEYFPILFNFLELRGPSNLTGVFNHTLSALLHTDPTNKKQKRSYNREEVSNQQTLVCFL